MGLLWNPTWGWFWCPGLAQQEPWGFSSHRSKIKHNHHVDWQGAVIEFSCRKAQHCRLRFRSFRQKVADLCWLLFSHPRCATRPALHCPRQPETLENGDLSQLLHYRSWSLPSPHEFRLQLESSWMWISSPSLYLFFDNNLVLYAKMEGWCVRKFLCVSNL